MHHGAASPSSDGGRRAVVVPGPVATLRTERLRLDPVAPADEAALFALHADPRAFSEDSTAPLTDPAQMRWVLRQWCADWERHGIGNLAVRARRPGPEPVTGDTEEPADTARTALGGHGAPLPPGLLGVVGLSPLEVAGTEVLSTYWRLDPRVTGRGVASEAMRAVLDLLAPDSHTAHSLPPDHRTTGHDDREVVAVTAAGNTPSLALAARLGFRPAPADRPVPGGREGDVLLVLPRDAGSGPAGS